MKKMFVVLLLIAFYSCHSPNQNNIPATNVSKDVTPVTEDGLNRHPTAIHYSKHAKCKMQCRHIDETEIKEMLQHGTINYKKSALNNDDCHKRYAVEGFAKNEHLRIIFASCANEVTVITCIDISNQWQCDCPGDKH